MKRLGKIAAIVLATLSVASLSACASCKKKKTPEVPTPPPATATGDCAKKGHEYSEKTGLCIRCEQKAVIPALTGEEKFSAVVPCTHDTTKPHGCKYQGSGENMWNRLELKEDCYTVEIGSKGALWLSFSVEKAGQYVLHSVDGDNGVKVTRHAANDSYVNEEGISAVEEDSNFYGYVNCGEVYYNAAWRATYCLKAAAGTKVKIRFIRIDEPAWEPKSVHTQVYATQLTEKAANVSNKELHVVPYESDFFFDESVGYYRMGTASNPGEIIYAAINKEAPRLFNEGTSFRNLRQGSPNSLNLTDGYTEEDDYNVLCYTPFIMNWVDENAVWYGENNYGYSTDEPAGDTSKKCYQNYCNDDGVYPVNKELYKFLTLYTKLNKPAGVVGEGDDAEEEISTELWQSGEADKYLWLAACYYYGEPTQGTENSPHLLRSGGNTVSTGLDYFYKIDGTGSYTLHCDTPNVLIRLRGQAAVALDGITVQGSDIFELYVSGGNVSITLTVTRND